MLEIRIGFVEGREGGREGGKGGGDVAGQEEEEKEGEEKGRTKSVANVPSSHVVLPFSLRRRDRRALFSLATRAM